MTRVHTMDSPGASEIASPHATVSPSITTECGAAEVFPVLRTIAVSVTSVVDAATVDGVAESAIEKLTS